MRLYRALLFGVCLIAAAIGGGAGPHPPRAFAVMRTWTGAGANSNWTNAANWGGTAPAAGDVLRFPSGAARMSNNNDFPAGTSFDQIQFSGTAGGYSLAGNRVSLATALVAGHTSGTDAVILSISGAAGVDVHGGGRIELSGNNSYSGDVVLSKGALRVKSATALGSTAGNTTVGGDAADGGGLEFDGTFTLAEEFDIDASDADLVHVFNGATTINSSIYISDQGYGGTGIEVLLNSKLTINGNITSGDVEKHGAGILAINGNLDGRVTNWAGTLELKGNARDANIDGGVGYLKGSMVGVDVSGAELVLTDEFGSIHTSGQFALTPSGTLSIDLLHPPTSPYPHVVTDSDQVHPDNAQLLLHAANVGPPGGVFTIISFAANQAVDGIFRNLPEGATVASGGNTFRISYIGGDGNDVTLTVLSSTSSDLRLVGSGSPEPATAGGNVDYSVQVTNFGPADAHNVVFTAQVAAGSSVVNLPSNPAWSCSGPPAGSTGQVKCIRDTLANGTVSPLTLTIGIGSGQTANVVTAFHVSAATPDAVMGNNDISVTTHVVAVGQPPGPGASLPNRRFLPQLALD